MGRRKNPVGYTVNIPNVPKEFYVLVKQFLCLSTPYHLFVFVYLLNGERRRIDILRDMQKQFGNSILGFNEDGDAKDTIKQMELRGIIQSRREAIAVFYKLKPEFRPLAKALFEIMTNQETSEALPPTRVTFGDVDMEEIY